MINEELTLVEEWIQPLIDRLRPVERRLLLIDVARKLRQRQSQRITKQIEPDGKAFEKRKPRKNRSGPMFMKLRQAKYLRATATPNDAQVGFEGRTAHIVRVNQEGLEDSVIPGGPIVKYPQRRLLGFGEEDMQWVIETVHQYLSSKG